MLASLQTLWRPDAPQLKVNMDREQARAMGVNINSAFNALAANLGNYYVNDFNKFGRAWQVIMSAEAEFRMTQKTLAVSMLKITAVKWCQFLPLPTLNTVVAQKP